MKHLSILGLLCSTASVVFGSPLTPKASKCPKPEGNTDAQLIAAFKSSDKCFSYTGAGNREKSIAPCAGADGYCQKIKGMKNDTAGCELFFPEGVKLDKSLANKDEDCNECDIETLVATWATQPATAFDKRLPKDKRSAAESKWRNDAFGTNGFVTAAKLKFPRPTGLPAGASIYGAYGWNHVTFDASNQKPNIGVTVKIV
ncbi:hypothetical protein CKAH01_13642 [Colletotrichum kahawae]|uniref:Uncharacterized protein n=1 Tax=Colletotrichum kahawae TaxID=34407 RepID=A0AAD9YNT1_COLKA|nr:hypothetical protein CKAH01_13642 [Colletotrichum kahawae]